MGDTSILAMDVALDILGVSEDVRNAIRLNNERARQLADTNRIVVLCMLLRSNKKAMSRIPMQIWKTLALQFSFPLSVFLSEVSNFQGFISPFELVSIHGIPVPSKGFFL